MANLAGTSTGTRKQDIRSSKAARRQSFIDAEVTPDQVRQYLVDTNTYEQFIELIQEYLKEALPVLWVCREEWVEAQNQQNDPKELEELLRDLATRTTERDAVVRERHRCQRKQPSEKVAGRLSWLLHTESYTLCGRPLHLLLLDPSPTPS
jgi:hypothetical protein